MSAKQPNPPPSGSRPAPPPAPPRRDRHAFPRRCEISTHQWGTTALCLLITNDGHAVVEHADGNVSLYALHPIGLYTIRFTDR